MAMGIIHRHKRTRMRERLVPLLLAIERRMR